MCRGALCPHARCPQNLYESIRNEPFKIPEDDGNDLTHTFFNPDREGWLLKLGELGPAPSVLFPLLPASSLPPHQAPLARACPPPPPEPGCHSPQTDTAWPPAATNASTAWSPAPTLLCPALIPKEQGGER